MVVGLQRCGCITHPKHQPEETKCASRCECTLGESADRDGAVLAVVLLYLACINMHATLGMRSNEK